MRERGLPARSPVLRTCPYTVTATVSSHGPLPCSIAGCLVSAGGARLLESRTADISARRSP
jgi:hypothetical protein